jgi:hypothetical protein
MGDLPEPEACGLLQGKWAEILLDFTKIGR